MRQRRDFDAHVHEYAALKIPALPFQATKRVFCKFTQHQPSPSRCSGEYKEGNATTCFWSRTLKGRKAERQKGRKAELKNSIHLLVGFRYAIVASQMLAERILVIAVSECRVWVVLPVVLCI